MEQIYPPESYKASAHIPLKEHFEKLGKAFSSELSLADTDNDINEIEYLLSIKKLMHLELSYNEIKHLSENCSIDHLTCDTENTINFPICLPEAINSSSKLPSPFITTDSNNLLVNKRLLQLEEQKNSTQLSLGNKRNYHKLLDFPMLTTPTDLVPGQDFVVSILVYRPMAFKFFSAKNTSEKLRFNHEIVALGSNTLEEVRNTIICLSDFGLCKEVESTSDDLGSSAKSLYPSGFLFIDDVFYNDFSDENAIDYSSPIIEWAKEKKIGNLQSRNMQSVRISDLSPRFGYPYVYIHQGDCEHLFVIADAKLLNSNDCLHSSCYPHVLKLNRNPSKMCLMCSVSAAKWICVKSDRLPQHKVFLCTECCNAYNYIDGVKLGNFKLYPYYEQQVLQ